MNITAIGGKLFYSDLIEPEDNIIFVFGSNPEGRHGAGAAKTAREKFGAIYGKGEGLQGNSYALPTKDLRIKVNNGLRSISKENIKANIKRLYNVAEDNPEKLFCIAYTNTEKPSLNGYTGKEMAQMFINARGIDDIPKNIVFSDTWKPYIIPSTLTIIEE